MRRTFVCTSCPAVRKTEVTNIHGERHEGCPDGDIGYWIEVPPPSSHCPHGLDWGDCNDCMIAGDLAFDAARERSVFGR